MDELEHLLRDSLHGETKKVALRCLRTNASLLSNCNLDSVAATHRHHWNHRNLAGAEEDPLKRPQALKKLFQALEGAARQLVGNAKALRSNPIARRWIRPEPVEGGPVFNILLWDFKIQALWHAAEADDLLGADPRDLASMPPLLSQLTALADLFEALRTSVEKVPKTGAKQVFEEETFRLIVSLHFFCLIALHDHDAKGRHLRPIARVVHEWVTSETVGPEWGKRQATRARKAFRDWLERTSQN